MDTVISRRYALEAKIGEGGMGTVYRARDRFATSPDEQIIALKQVITIRVDIGSPHSWTHDSTDFRLALAQEFKTLASLRHPNIISVLDYGFDEQNTPYYTMDYIENTHTLLETAKKLRLRDQVDLLIQVLQALEYLHRRGIVHRDLKPANILVKTLPDGGRQVKVVDFGLAIANGQRSENETVGTLAYIAPELFIGGSASPVSDLYSFGVIAYEMFAGHHPFDTTNAGDLINQVLNRVPDVEALDIDERVGSVLQRLLLKDPTLRYQSAHEIIHAYNAAIGVQLTYETVATRESFLQAAEFVGRKREMDTLADAVHTLLNCKTGSAWLIGGESGVGKSRLMDEIRTFAQVRGIQVLRGQSITENATPYYTWREIFRWLALVSNLTDFEAAVLKPLIPDLENLIGRQVPPAPQIVAQAAQDRLLMVVENLFRRQTHPHLLVLEDLHWAQESLEVLERLSQIVHETPLMLIGSYRDEERPQLPKQLPAMQVIKLERLKKDEIAALSESMLGSSTQPDLVDLLQRETEGNVFFLVEVVRTLAEDAGRLDLVGTLTLPERVFAGGVQRVIDRRLGRIPSRALELLKLMALSGRKIDLELAKTLVRQTPALLGDMPFDLWLTLCSDATILTFEEGKWQFGHDKLREGLLNRIAESDKPNLHHRIAAALEIAHPNEYGRLAYHYQHANKPEKAAHYAGLAGEQALMNGAYERAIELLNRALNTQRSPIERAHIEQLLGDALYGMGMLVESRHHSETALKLLGYPMPTTNSGRILKLVRQIGRQITHRAFAKRMIGSQPDHRQALLEACRAYERLSIVNYMFNETLSTVLSTLYAVNLAELAGDSPELARTSANVGVAIGLIPLHNTAERYFERALASAKQHGLHAERWVSVAYGTYQVGMGRLEAADNYLKRSRELARQMGDERAFEESYVVSSSLRYHQGDFEGCLQDSHILFTSALKRGDFQNYDSGSVLHLAGLQRTGQLNAALSLCERLESRLSQSVDKGHKISGYGTMALVYAQLGDIEHALKTAEQATAIIFKESPVSYYSLLGYNHLAELYLMLLEQGNRDVSDTVQRLCKALTAFARPFPVAKAAAARCQGIYQQLIGQTNVARSTWEQGLQVAAQNGQQYEAACIRDHLAKTDSL